MSQVHLHNVKNVYQWRKWIRFRQSVHIKHKRYDLKHSVEAAEHYTGHTEIFQAKRQTTGCGLTPRVSLPMWNRKFWRLNVHRHFGCASHFFCMFRKKKTLRVFKESFGMNAYKKLWHSLYGCHYTVTRWRQMTAIIISSFIHRL
jgi:hypothetical protein